jgi:hypothetical protein
MAAKTLAIADTRARNAASDAEWASVFSDVQNSGWLSPVQKEKALAHYMALRDERGKKVKAAGIAEGALKSGQDGITPWVDPGKAQAAFEASIAGEKDPLVVEDARQRFTQALAQNTAARTASDAPYIGAIESDIYRGRGVNRLSDEYKALSPVGQAHVEKTAAAEARSRKVETRAAQSERDAEVLGLMEDLTIAERKDVDLVGDPRFQGVTQPTLTRLKKKRADAVSQFAVDHGVSADKLNVYLRDTADELGYGKKASVDFADAVKARLVKDFPDAKKPPTVADVDRIVGDEILYGESDTFGPSVNKSRWKARLDNTKEWKPFDAAGQPSEVKAWLSRRNAPRAAAPAAPAGPRVTRTIDGVTKVWDPTSKQWVKE